MCVSVGSNSLTNLKVVKYSRAQYFSQGKLVVRSKIKEAKTSCFSVL